MPSKARGKCPDGWKHMQSRADRYHLMEVIDATTRARLRPSMPWSIGMWSLICSQLTWRRPISRCYYPVTCISYAFPMQLAAWAVCLDEYMAHFQHRLWLPQLLHYRLLRYRIRYRIAEELFPPTYSRYRPHRWMDMLALGAACFEAAVPCSCSIERQLCIG